MKKYNLESLGKEEVQNILKIFMALEEFLNREEVIENITISSDKDGFLLEALDHYAGMLRKVESEQAIEPIKCEHVILVFSTDLDGVFNCKSCGASIGRDGKEAEKELRL